MMELISCCFIWQGVGVDNWEDLNSSCGPNSNTKDGVGYDEENHFNLLIR